MIVGSTYYCSIPPGWLTDLSTTTRGTNYLDATTTLESRVKHEQSFTHKHEQKSHEHEHRIKSILGLRGETDKSSWEGLEPPQTRGGNSALERGRGDDFRSLSPWFAAGYQ